MPESKAIAAKSEVSESLALVKVSEKLHQSGIFPNVKSPSAAFAIVQYGHEIGIGPMIALQNINFISGKPVCSGQLLLAQAFKVGVTMDVIRQDADGCELIFHRPGHRDYKASFTKEDASAAGLLGKDNWKRYPKDMYYWRAVANGVRRIAPDAVMGAYTAEEITGGQTTDPFQNHEPHKTVIDTTAETVDTTTGEVTTQDHSPSGEAHTPSTGDSQPKSSVNMDGSFGKPAGDAQPQNPPSNNDISVPSYDWDSMVAEIEKKEHLLGTFGTYTPVMLTQTRKMYAGAEVFAQKDKKTGETVRVPIFKLKNLHDRLSGLCEKAGIKAV